jgi:nucleoside-diphosphate-sugar epimerase
MVPSPASGLRVVVTGGAGYIGSTLVPLLLDAGHQVLVLDNLMYGGLSMMPHFLRPGFRFAEVDITDAAALKPHLQGADVVIHLAALVGYPLCKKVPRRAVEVNVDGTRNVLDLMPPDARLLYGSTGSNYGEVLGVCTEDTPLNPLSLYGETKTRAEAMCQARGNCVSMRFATAFGLSPRLRLDLMINDFAWQAIHRRFLVVYERHFRRTFIHVRDIARAFVHMIERWDRLEHRLFNVGHDSMNYTQEDVVGLLQRRIDFQVHFAEVGRDEDRRDYAVDYGRVRAAGFEIGVDIERGLHELAQGLPLLRLQNPYSNV